MKTVLVDIYGADIGCEPMITGAIKALDDYSDLNLTFIGDENIINKFITKENSQRISVMHTTDYISHSESPAVAFKGRDEASIIMGIKELNANDEVIGLLSPGNTGAMLVASIFRLGLVGGLKSPALCSVIPCCDGKMLAISDCGANIDSRSEDLVNFGLMASALMKCLGHSDFPKVALLSVGREDTKGNKVTLEAFERLKNLPINFVGNIEGLDVVSGEVDVVVADGFSGNVLLKTIESVGKSAISMVNDAIKNAGVKEDLESVKQRLERSYDFNPFGGATFLGTKKPIIKMHGSATEITPRSCIDQLMRMENANYQQAILECLKK